MQKEEIDLRDRTKEFALRVLRMFPTLPSTTEAQILGKQVLRAGTSVGANYREAYRGRRKAEFIAKCGDSLRELEETAYWLELLVDGGIVKRSIGRSPQRVQRTDSNLRHDPQTRTIQFLILPSSFLLL